MGVPGKKQGVVAVLMFIAGVLSNSISFGAISVYDGDFDVSISDKGWMADAAIDVKDHQSVFGGKVFFTGRFRPIEPYRLLQFDGQDTYRCHRFQIYEAFYTDGETPDGFEVMITNPEPATALLLAVGVCLMLFQGRRQGH